VSCKVRCWRRWRLGRPVGCTTTCLRPCPRPGKGSRPPGERVHGTRWGGEWGGRGGREPSFF
jgi:hypothetical protein